MEQKDRSSKEEFTITPKATHTWLLEQNTAVYAVRKRISSDMIANAKELEDGVNWVDVLQHTTALSDGKRYTGETALAFSVASSVGSLARNFGWNMDSPEVVYMSGFHFATSLGRDLTTLNAAIQRAETGERVFLDETVKQETMKREREKAGRLGMYRKKLTSSLDDYADQNLPQGEQYRTVLELLLYMSHTEARADRKKIIQLVKAGELSEAQRLLTGSKTVNHILS